MLFKIQNYKSVKCYHGCEMLSIFDLIYGQTNSIKTT